MPAAERSRTLLVWLLLAAVAAAGTWVVLHLLRPVAVVSAARPGRAVNAVPGSVTVSAEYQMELKSEIGGRVLRSALDPGLPVRAGDFLVQLDPADLRLEIERIESEAEAHARRVAVGSAIRLELETAREAAANMERMLKLGNISEVDVTKQQRLVKQFEQKLELEVVENALRTSGFENTLKVKRRQLDKMTITAPFDGVVSQVFARPGDLISEGAPIATVIATGRTVEAKISEENFSGVRVGQKASVRFLGYGPQLYGASVTKVLPTADPETQRYVVHVNVDLAPEKLVPGLTGEISIVIGERDARTIVPRRALRGNDLLLVSGGRVERRTVRLGYVGLNQVEVLEGLAPGDRVIVEELDRFQPGDRVRPREPAPERP
jgi:RND family efflux transporter MFP subunit